MPKFRVFLRFRQSRFRAKMLGYESPEPSDVIKAFFLTDTDIKLLDRLDNFGEVRD